ncbi:MAG: Spi family protease inhibitor, partial [Bacteroidales bacterium]|nr:Spi family protease inhibitor [Bacteroidales bacterium]
MKILRKLALSLLILLAALPAFAGGVSRENAAETAAAFFRGDAKRASTSAGAKVTPAGEQSPAYAAFNREGGGFVVIALNDAVTPVLAYSDQGFFPSREEMPEAMAW